jgi:hypothetical protein
MSFDEDGTPVRTKTNSALEAKGLLSTRVKVSLRRILSASMMKGTSGMLKSEHTTSAA